jgi:hypothetical protein
VFRNYDVNKRNGIDFVFIYYQLNHIYNNKSARESLSTKKEERDLSRCIERTKGGLNSKLHALRDGSGRPGRQLLTENQASDRKGCVTPAQLSARRQKIAG